MIIYRSEGDKNALCHVVQSHAWDYVWENNSVCVKIIHAQQKQLASQGAVCCNPGVKGGRHYSESEFTHSE